MKKITLQTVVDAINHCSDKQQKEMLRQLNKGHQSWAGIILGEMIKDYVESIDEENEGPSTQRNLLSLMRMSGIEMRTKRVYING